MSKVIIGIVTKHKKNNDTRTNGLIRDEVKQAIFDNGAIAIAILSPNDKIQYCGDDWKTYEQKIRTEEIIEQIKLCDGIILQGGTENEAYEYWIAKYCYDNDIPVLGICAGQNYIVGALGGKTTLISNPEKHMRVNDIYVHSIKILRNSKFYKIVEQEEIMVNSRHKRTVLECPKLDKVAFDEDGNIEVVEAKNKSFYMGIRFHPESLYKVDEKMNNIFVEFIKSCADKKTQS